jgi:AcrR family transcriptional regulator
MDDLAAELGMSKKTMYAHFPSKTALLEAVVEDKIAEVDADLGSIVEAEASGFPEVLHEALACVRRHSEELQPPFLRDVAREAPALFALVRTRRRVVLQRHFGRLLGTGREAGMIRKDIPTKLAIEILISSADAMINPQKLSELNIPAKTCLSALLAIFLEGMISDKGRRRL